jgi:23S rRNA U2552 (ribose-2'-O)-methylase RlmE/FtsJ
VVADRLALDHEDHHLGDVRGVVTEQTLLLRLKKSFAGIRHVKPPASRKDSAEIYLVATGFRGA